MEGVQALLSVTLDLFSLCPVSYRWKGESGGEGEVLQAVDAGACRAQSALWGSVLIFISVMVHNIVVPLFPQSLWTLASCLQRLFPPRRNPAITLENIPSWSPAN